MLEKKPTVTDGLRIASSALDVHLGTSFTTSSVKRLKIPGNGCHDFSICQGPFLTLFGARG